jgi:nitroimidazol reductase NimA-like FMN-containing flavoprotein (pyridoxamine 5'-phosphate oxidase superfamily)
MPKNIKVPVNQALNRKKEIRRILSTRHLGVLATTASAGPYATLVCIAVSRNLKQVVFATPRDTVKFKNLKNNPAVSLLVDTRDNTRNDARLAAAITVLGEAAEPDKSRAARFRRLLLQRHPYLRDFCNDPRTALMVVTIRQTILVRQFIP